MLKRIPKSDISIRPFKAYKEWSFDDISGQIDLLYADINSDELSGEYPKNSIYGQLKAQFYTGDENNPFIRFGTKKPVYRTGIANERYIGDTAKVLSIPQIYVGEGIKRGSLTLNDNGLPYVDDGYGSLIGDYGDTLDFIFYDNQNESASFDDWIGNNYFINLLTDNGTVEGVSLDIENARLQGTYDGEYFSAIVYYFNVESGKMLVDNFEFLNEEAASERFGNIFYNQGLVVLTRRNDELLNSTWDISFKSTKTIYEHEYLLIVNPDEFNVSQNPSAIKEVGFEYEYVTGSDGKIYKAITTTGARYIRKKAELENGEVLDYRYQSSVNSDVYAGFEHWDVSGSVDTTGSFLTPFITTIGLYDDDMDLVAVAKLPQPIKSEPDFPVNFIVRFDI